jgi:hypothetical protein
VLVPPVKLSTPHFTPVPRDFIASFLKAQEVLEKNCIPYQEIKSSGFQFSDGILN